MTRPFPITAMSMRNALGDDCATVAAALRQGQSGLVPCPSIPSGPPLPFDTHVGILPGPLPPLPEAFGSYDTRIARLAAALLGDIAVATDAAVSRWGPQRVGLLLGTTTAGVSATEAAYAQRITHGELPRDYDFFLHHGFETLAEPLAELTGIDGPSLVVSTACSSSAKVFGTARRLIEAGVLDAAIVGGLDVLCHTTLRGFHALGVLDTERCKPFSRARRGISLGEGGAMALIERDGEGSVGLLGVGETSDAHHMSAPHPEGEGARRAMEEALRCSGWTPTDVDHVNAHGTGTHQNDLAEAKAIAAALGSAVPVASTKGATGHLLGAAGATEVLIAAMAITEGFVPGSVGVEPADEALEIDVATTTRDLRPRRVLSNSFAFGGNNCCVALGALT